MIALAGIISGTIALVIAFLLHSYITWRDRHVTHREIFKFIAITGAGMWILRPILLSVFISFDNLYHWAFIVFNNLHIPLSQSFVSNTGAFCLMILVLLCYNYVAYEYFVFKRKRKEE